MVKEKDTKKKTSDASTEKRGTKGSDTKTVGESKGENSTKANKAKIVYTKKTLGTMKKKPRERLGSKSPPHRERLSANQNQKGRGGQEPGRGGGG